MDQQVSNTDLVAQAQEAQNMPELLDAFESIEKMKVDEPEGIIDEINEEPQENIQEEEQEDNEISDPSNESEEEEIVLKSPYREKKADKIRKLQNDKYRALAEKEDALQRLAKMESMLEESLSSGTYHYGRNVYSELDKAKANWQKEFNEGNEAGLMDAQLALIKAQHAVSELETWANQNDNKQYPQNNVNYQNNNVVPNVQFQNPNLVQPNQYQSNNSYNPYQESLQQEIANDWLDSHPYLKPHSRSYDAKLAGDVTNFINKLDNNLYRNNDADAIFSEEYFYTIDSYIKTLTTSKRDNSKNLEALSNVSGVRNTSSGGSVNKSLPINEVTLTKTEKIMADNAGISHKEWLKYKIDDLKNNNGVTYGR